MNLIFNVCCVFLSQENRPDSTFEDKEWTFIIEDVSILLIFVYLKSAEEKTIPFKSSDVDWICQYKPGSYFLLLENYSTSEGALLKKYCILSTSPHYLLPSKVFE